MHALNWLRFLSLAPSHSSFQRDHYDLGLFVKLKLNFGILISVGVGLFFFPFFLNLSKSVQRHLNTLISHSTRIISSSLK